MGRKSLGTSLERRMVRNAFKDGGWGFRAPGSGTFTVDKGKSKRDGLQEECSIPIPGTLSYFFRYVLDYLKPFPLEIFSALGTHFPVPLEKSLSKNPWQIVEPREISRVFLKQDLIVMNISRNERERQNVVTFKSLLNQFIFRFSPMDLAVLLYKKSYNS